MTFSIVASDPEAGEWGVAVASKFLAVGSIVPWARAGAGAVATQALANVSYGPRGLDLLASGESASAVVASLTGSDGGRDERQIGAVDARGRATSYTGRKCIPWAGGRTGPGFAVQGNLLASERVVDASAQAMAQTKGALAGRLLAALKAGDAEGGDRRGRQSAALLVVKEGGGYGGAIDRMIDLRVDDHAAPVIELERLLSVWRLHFEKPSAPAVPLQGDVALEVEGALRRLGHLPAAAPLTPEALRSFLHTENFEERETPGFTIDPAVLDWLRGRR